MLTYDLTARGRKTMYEYLYEAMKADILSGRLAAGEKLPSKRAFAEHLQVSVKTVENTYEQLLLEGYIRSEEKRGYFVNRLEVKNVSAPAYASFVTRFREEEYLADLTANNIQYDKFPFATWAKIMRQTLTDYDTSLLKTVPFNGVEKLRVAIAEHLYRYRGTGSYYCGSGNRISLQSSATVIGQKCKIRCGKSWVSQDYETV